MTRVVVNLITGPQMKTRIDYFLFLALTLVLTACQPNNANDPLPAVESTALTLQPVFGGRQFNQPVAMTQAPDDADTWFVAERAGRIYRLAATSSDSGLFADLSDRVNASFTESGLLSFTFHPDYSHNHYIYVTYTATGNPLVSRLSRFTVADDGSAIEKDSEQIVLSLDNLYDKHNITQVGFGPDGFLYVGFGDGHEGESDPLAHGQNTNTLMAAILRIDVNKGSPYSIPQDNPFANGSGGKPELFAWGFRNPWRWSFDRHTGELWVGDVGEYHWEEVDLVKNGGNYGWPIREGSHCLGSRVDCIKKWLCLWDCPDANLQSPMVDYSHDEGCAVIGGYVYRGQALPDLAGAYLFSDACSATIWALSQTTKGYRRNVLYKVDEQKRAGGFLTVSFAQGNNGDLYVIYYNGGIYKLVASS